MDEAGLSGNGRSNSLSEGSTKGINSGKSTQSVLTFRNNKYQLLYDCLKGLCEVLLDVVLYLGFSDIVWINSDIFLAESIGDCSEGFIGSLNLLVLLS